MSLVTFTAGSLGDILAVSGLIFNIIRSLNEGSFLSSVEEDLISSLHSLKSITAFAGRLLQLFNTVTGRSNSLPADIHNGLVGCRQDLNRFLNTIQDSRCSLQETLISSLWKRLWWAANGPGEIKQMLDSVERHKTRLSLMFGMLITSTSQQVSEQVQKPLSNQRRAENMHIPTVYIQCDDLTSNRRRLITSAGTASSSPSRTPFFPSTTIMSSSPKRMRTIYIRGPVGYELCVSISGVCTWTDLHRIILGYVQGRAGYGHVLRHAYQLLDKDGNFVNTAQGFPSELCEGAVLEMAMLVESYSDSMDTIHHCPRCKHVNPAPATDRPSDSEWISCLECDVLFRTTEKVSMPDDDIISPELRSQHDWVQDIPYVKFFSRIHQVLIFPGSSDCSAKSEISSWSGAGFNMSFSRLLTSSPNALEPCYPPSTKASGDSDETDWDNGM